MDDDDGLFDMHLRPPLQRPLVDSVEIATAVHDGMVETVSDVGVVVPEGDWREVCPSH